MTTEGADMGEPRKLEVGVTTTTGGHVFRMDEDGEVDTWAFDGNWHNGPACIQCDRSWCHHCVPDVYSKKCPASP